MIFANGETASNAFLIDCKNREIRFVPMAFRTAMPHIPERRILMNAFLKDFGIFAIGLLICIVYKKYLDFYDAKRSVFLEDGNVYQAAEKFAGGASFREVSDLLMICHNFDEDNVKNILQQSFPHKAEKDGGYRFFIRAVNKELGEDIYKEKRK